jgi:hypothetical protein
MSFLTSPNQLRLSGSGAWAAGASRVNYSFSIIDNSEMVPLHQRIGTVGPGIFVVIKAAIAGEYDVEALNWIEYTAALHNGAPYTPEGGWPWVGINVGGRLDGSPYSETPEAQRGTIEGYGYGWRSAVRDLNDPRGIDALFLNWPASGGLPNWRHESVVVLMARCGGSDHVAGALKFVFATDKSANLCEYGATAASMSDLQVWRDALIAGYPNYVNDNL